MNPTNPSRQSEGRILTRKSRIHGQEASGRLDALEGSASCWRSRGSNQEEGSMLSSPAEISPGNREDAASRQEMDRREGCARSAAESERVEAWVRMRLGCASETSGLSGQCHPKYNVGQGFFLEERPHEGNESQQGDYAADSH